MPKKEETAMEYLTRHGVEAAPPFGWMMSEDKLSMVPNPLEQRLLGCFKVMLANGYTMQQLADEVNGMLDTSRVVRKVAAECDEVERLMKLGDESQ